MLAVSGSLCFERGLTETAQAKTEIRKTDTSKSTYSELILKKYINELEITLKKVLDENNKFRIKTVVVSENKNLQHGQEGFKCGDCGKTYKYKSSLESHQTSLPRKTTFDPKDGSCAYPCNEKGVSPEAPVGAPNNLNDTEEDNVKVVYQCEKDKL